ncbi:hypothetical protein EJ05DRAFT_53663 [Pseudovirgaria hyperparasitica]|uniref:HTH OST-type domain-containing protein n=1 Tax=Pseudovirgaria hyperparasitica TaxID=470096 RepID=A0A6A6W7J0_9PEZI|nr:uncharacterized protein EJ05DRAFT_53663 [Pseudovirgaria hyperparasitica]KAF2757051.1 hypothetical protein EJ05DRAFT_53663 [Pseudovirgaria hyperparasitica]
MANNANLALLIDGENISPRILTGLMAAVVVNGDAVVRRMYADWTDPSFSSYKAHLRAHSITPVQQHTYKTTNKATQGVMVTETMILLRLGRFASFCIVSGNTDYTLLAAHIRKQGVAVHGFGARKTSCAFIAACTNFTYFDALDVDMDKSPEQQQQVLPPSTVRPSFTLASQQTPTQGPVSDASKTALTPVLVKSLRLIVVQIVPDWNEPYTSVADVAKYLSTIAPNFDVRTYGFEHLGELLETSGLVDVKKMSVVGQASVALVRLKKRV